MNIIDGRQVAERITVALQSELAKRDSMPTLHCLLVGEDPASLLYLKRKEEYAERLGVGFVLHQLPSGASREEVSDMVLSLNATPDAFIVQLPLPAHLHDDTDDIIQSIDPSRDADGLTLVQRQRVSDGQKGIVATPVAAVIALLNSIAEEGELEENLPFHYNYNGVSLAAVYKGKRAMVLSDGDVFGDNIATLLTQAGMVATVRSSVSCALEAEALAANVVVTALGQPGFLQGDMITKGTIVIDVGTTLVGGKTLGDVDWASIQNVAAAATPVPGGVGPVTVAMLYANLLSLTK